MQDGFEVAETLLINTKEPSRRPTPLSRAEIRLRREPEVALGRPVFCAPAAESASAFPEHE